MNKNVVRISLDVVMVVLLVLMYEARVLGLGFHEIGGLAACGLFIVHNGINRKWITGVTRRLLNASLPVRTRVSYTVNVLLLVSMAFIALSGIMISRTVLVGINGDVAFWRPAHYFASAVALMLIGIHIGLHWSFIRSMFTRFARVPRVVVRPVGAVCLAAVLVFGAYSLVVSSLVDWLDSPFDADTELSQGQGLGRHGVGGGGGGSTDSGGVLEVVAAYGSITVVFSTLTAVTEGALKKRQKKAKLALQPA